MTIVEMTRGLGLIRSAAGVLGWDQETMLPRSGAAHRAAQLAWLSARAHEMATSDAWRRALEAGEAEAEGADFRTRANLRELRREFNRATKLPVEFVERQTRASSLAKHTWAAARKASDFGAFAPHLEGLLALAREKAELLGYPGEPYDALLEGYERGMTTADVASIFDRLRPESAAIAAAAVERSAMRRVTLPAGPYPVEAQQAFNGRIAAAVGFDFSAGRIDTTTHPFCTRVGPHDVRLTTRYDVEDFTSSLFGVLHEAGHGLYEQGLPAEDYGLPSGGSVSLGIHESQSRLWENHVGRSAEFWERWYPDACAAFPQLRGFPLEDFLTYLRRAEFSPIRVEADEATYDLHILLRFDIERQMLNGSLAVAEVPQAWNDGFRGLFGFAPPDDRHGCLQDIHWSMGGLGYFATYTLGNLNAAQLFEAARRDAAVASAADQADYGPLLGWMRERVHAHGGTLDPAELMERATGSPPDGEAYLRHLRARYL